MELSEEQKRLIKQKLNSVIYNILVCDLNCKRVSSVADSVAEVTMLRLQRIAKQQQEEENERQQSNTIHRKMDSHKNKVPQHRSKD